MSKVEEIKEQIQSLSREEFAELRDWFTELELDATLDTEEAAAANPGRLVEDVMAKIRKNL